MKKLSTVMALVAIGMGFAIQEAAAAAPSKDSVAAQSAEPLSTQEVYRLYANRSWMWKDGSGYFPAKERRFVASTGNGSKGSYAVGRWFITDPGKLCFDAKWYAKDGASSALTCFSHREKNGVVFQKREPDGDWYVFKHARAQAGDEYRKLRLGNYVDARFKRVEARLSGSK
ncbi:DUF995 domain-containing protein [Mesorhizobium sp. YR577]|uniref:DUF995 domain-containing protein n=1 Tax=Mesorhizobium sp. YR577 TaxID=1884373 RepID=UPI0008E6AA73|nr:DUF995 domain-containing protein [Mesorhizobium sp. YR577]SFU20379.1 Protein of unknown function [Mesorhizobium sp. YR577]